MCLLRRRYLCSVYQLNQKTTKGMKKKKIGEMKKKNQRNKEKDDQGDRANKIGEINQNHQIEREKRSDTRF